MWTNALSWMCKQMTSEATRSATSSPELADGRTPCASPDGPTTDLFGQAPVRVSRSASRANKPALTIPGTSGRNLLGSSATQALQRSLANRLAERLTGSVSCEVIWTRWDTAWGQCLLKPRARTRSISGTDIGLWPTAQARATAGGDYADPAKAAARIQSGHQVNLSDLVIALYSTMTSNSPAKDYNEAGNSAGQVALRKIALALYPTTTASDHKSRSASQATLDRNARPLRKIVFALWSTVRSSDGEKGGPNQSFGAGVSPLPSQVSTAASILSAPMENGAGSLHPEFAGWELGYPPEWLDCAPSGIPLIRGRQRPSSKHV